LWAAEFPLTAGLDNIFIWKFPKNDKLSAIMPGWLGKERILYLCVLVFRGKNPGFQFKRFKSKCVLLVFRTIKRIGKIANVVCYLVGLFPFSSFFLFFRFRKSYTELKTFQEEYYNTP
jgi:hypothetical protein